MKLLRQGLAIQIYFGDDLWLKIMVKNLNKNSKKIF